jgi:uncharacterized protein (TIGR02145 family)
MKNIFKAIVLFLGIYMISACKTDELLKVTKLQTGEITNITSNSATATGIFIDLSGNVTEYGHCWNKTGSPTIFDNKFIVTEDVKKGEYKSTISNLVVDTKYYVRAYAIDDNRNIYGDQIDFSTHSEIPIVTTTEISNITNKTAMSGGSNISDGGSNISSKGVCWSLNQTPSINDYKTNEGNGNGNYSSTITGLSDVVTYYYCAYATNSAGTGYGTVLSFVTKLGDSDGNFYNTIIIGTQRWMGENLKTRKFNDGQLIPNYTNDADWSNLSSSAFCWYNNDEPNNKNKYGALYNWYAINSNKLCPSGWHLPSIDEWNTLVNYLISNGYNYDGSTAGNKIAKAMASLSNWNFVSGIGLPGNNDYTEYRNKSGYNGQPAGYRDETGVFSNLGMYSRWWSSTEFSNADAYYFYIFNMNYYTSMNYKSKKIGASVRCIKN